MKYIESREALEKIKSMGISYVMEFDLLNYLIEENKKVECLINDGVMLVINYSNDADLITVLPMSETFDAEELLSLICEKSENPSLLINIHKLLPDFTKELDIILRRKLTYERNYTDYVFANNVQVDTPADVRLLTASDKDVFTAFSDEKIKNRPPLSVLFDVFVNKNQGYILAAFEGEKIIGYLAFCTVSDTVYDVDYIYVLPEKRGKGIGKKLASAYVSYAKENKRQAYWSNAQNEASEKTAKGCGFEKIREARKYVFKENTD